MATVLSRKPGASGGGGAPSGPAGGDLTGTYPNPTLAVNRVPYTIFDAKGDILAASAADTPARLAVGTNGQGLVAASGQATGLAWQYALGFHGVQAQEATDQVITTGGSGEAIDFADADIYDTDGYHDPGGANPSRLTVPAGLGGYYRVWAGLRFEDSPANFFVRAQIALNGSVISRSEDITTESGAVSPQYRRLKPSLILALVATDFVQVFVDHNKGTDLTLASSNATAVFGMELLGV